MAKDKLAQIIVQEDEGRAEALRRAEKHQDNLAKENQENRMERIEAAQGEAETVQVKITKFGDMQVSTGEHVPGDGDTMAKHGDVLTVSDKVGKALEKRGFAEIV